MKALTTTFLVFIFSLTFTVVNAQTCSDGIQNGSETGIDCGGTCPPCSTPCQITLNYETPTYNPPPVAGPGYTMANGTPITTDGGTFYDPGGPSGNYANSTSYTQTFCSSVVDGQIQFNFTSWAIETCCDHLTIYDGPTASGPVLFSGTTSPGIVASTNGCLTFTWTTDGSVVYAGWAATITIVNVQIPLECTGGDVVFTASGQGASVLALDNDFDFGTAGSGWTSNVSASFTNPCDPSIDGGTYMWMGNSAPHPRIIQTVPLDLSCGGTTCFWLDFATQGDASPCEGIDLPDEGVYFEYSINGGTSWVTMEYYGPAGVGNNTSSGGTDPQMTSWNQYCLPIPPAAETATTIIRWAQTGSSGIANDHWGIDNVTISSVADCTPYWYDYDYLPPSNDNPVQNATITSSGTYTVTYTNGTDACSTSVNIVLPPCPCPDATVTGGGPYCAGDSIPDVVFTINGGQFPIELTYAIDGVAQTPVSFSSNSFTIYNPTEADYTILGVTDITACVGTFSGSVNVVENAIPVFNSISGGDSYCTGETVSNVTVDATGSGPITVSYTLNGVAQTPVTGTAPISLGAQAGIYAVTSITDGLCSLAVTASDTIVVFPPVTATAGTTTAVICAGQTIALTGNTAAGTYSWTGPNGYTNTFEDPTIANATVAASGTYTLTMTNNGCVSAPSTVDVLVNPVPVLTVNSDETICIGTPVTLTAQGATTYSWSDGVVNGTAFTPNSTVTYTVTGTANGCSSTATVTITVLPLPIADATLDVDYGYQPLTVTFTNTSQNATNYLWDFGTGQTSTSATPTVTNTFNSVGTYYVVLTASNGVCFDLWTDSVVVIPYPEMVIDVPNVFTPNGDGSNDVYFISVQNGTSFEAVIINRWGNVVHTIDTLNTGWDGKINGNDANEGVYFIKYTANGLDGQTAEGHTYFHLVR